MSSPVKPSDIKPEAEAEAPPAIGHNQPPKPYRIDVVEEHAKSVREWADAAGDWLDLKEITTEAQSTYLTDFLDGARKKRKALEDDRKADKEPHQSKADAVDAVYKVPRDIIDKCGKTAKALLTPWLEKKQREEEERQREEQRKAAEAARKAEEQAQRAAQANDVAGMVEAEKAQKDAAKQQKTASKTVRAQVKSASGAGRTVAIRKQKHAKITNESVLFMVIKDEPEIRAAMQSVADRIIRSKEYDGRLSKCVEIEERGTAA